MLRRWAPILAPLLVLLAYVRVLGAPFVWDDRHLIVDAPSVEKLQPIASYFGSAFWQSPETGDLRGYYRPLTISSFALDHAVHGENPAGFHLTNLIFHVANVLLLYFALRKFKVPPAIAFGLDLVWGLAPRLTEAAAWIAGRTDVLATTFVLAALIAHRRHRVSRVVIASLLVFVGLFAKEVAIAGAVAIAATEILGKAPLRRRLALAAIPLVLAAAYFAIRQSVLAGPREETLHAKLAMTSRAMLALASIGEYARMLAVPWFPELQIGIGIAPSHAMMIVGALVVIALVAIVIRARRVFLVPRKNVQVLVVFGSALAACGLGVVLHLVPIAVNVVAADRFLYLPTAGLVLAIAPCVSALRIRESWKLAGALVLAATFFAGTFVRIGDWCDELDLWAKAYRDTSKQNALPLNELGNLYYRAALYEDAAAIYARAVPNGVFDPRIAQANHANAMGQLGHYDEAARELAALCARDPHIADNCLYAGMEELHNLHFDEARTFMRMAIERTSNHYPDATRALELVARAEAAQNNPALASPDPVTHFVASFELAALVGRRPDTLHFASLLIATQRAPHAARREAAEYFARFGPPGDLVRVLGNPAASDVLDASLRSAVDLRTRTAEELVAKWPTLGFAE